MRLNLIYTIIFLLTIIPGTGSTALAGELISPRLDAAYTKSPDGTKRISVSLSARIDDKRINISDATIQITASGESGNPGLGTVVTKSNGKAVLDIPSGVSLPKDPEGYYTFILRFAGNQKLGEASKTFRVMDAFMEMSFVKVDTVNNVQVKVFKINEKGEKTVVPDVPVEFYIKRLFCLYPFGSEKTDSTGTCTAEFPRNMPGDTTGKVIVISKILENDEFATVETMKDFAGGKPVIIEPMKRRGLGDTDAPLWMVYTLLVLLSGVWIHVAYVIGSIIRINTIGKRELARQNSNPDKPAGRDPA